MADPPPPQYPIRCLKCDKVMGFPFLVRTLSDQPGHIEVQLRCRECGHEWVQIVSSKQ